MAIDVLAFFEYERLPEPYLLFNSRMKFISPRTGLTKVGPYDIYLHRNDEIHVGLITESDIISNAKNFIQSIKKGYDYYKGFKSIFKVKEFMFDDDFVKVIKNSSGNILTNIESAYLELAEKLPEKSIIIIVVRDEIIEKHYARIKTIRLGYMKKTVRLQLIKKSILEKVLGDKTALEFTLFNVATAIYTKSGGIPWILDKQLIPAGIFIGIAFTKPKIISSNNRTKEIFYYGILTVYNKFGKYLDMSARGIQIEAPTPKIRGTKGLYIPMNDMIEMLKQIIGAYKPPVVIFHKSARFHNDEIKAIRNVLEDKSISYALIHVESSNPYRGYGEDRYDLTAVRGDLVLDKESNNRAILFTTGCTQSEQGIQRRNRPGSPKPLELEIEGNTTPYSAKDFAGQILGLTKLDWNTTDLEVRMPITIKYARKIANLTRYLTSTAHITDVRELM